jgi:hypothetical protein
MAATTGTAKVPPAPLAWLPGIMLPLYGAAITIGMYLLTDFSSDLQNCLLFPLAYGLGLSTIALDYAMSPTLKQNLGILASHGYTTKQVLGIMVLNLLLSNGTTLTLARLLCAGYKWRVPDLALVGKVSPLNFPCSGPADLEVSVR